MCTLPNALKVTEKLKSLDVEQVGQKMWGRVEKTGNKMMETGILNPTN